MEAGQKNASGFEITLLNRGARGTSHATKSWFVEEPPMRLVILELVAALRGLRSYS